MCIFWLPIPFSLGFPLSSEGWPCGAGLRFRREIPTGGIMCRFFDLFLEWSIFIHIAPTIQLLKHLLNENTSRYDLLRYNLAVKY
jgi:hypothetical protein